MTLQNTIQFATQTLIDHVQELTVLDQAIGDGDHGLNMKRGAEAIQAKLHEMAPSFGVSLSKDEKLLEASRGRTTKVLKLG